MGNILNCKCLHSDPLISKDAPNSSSLGILKYETPKKIEFGKLNPISSNDPKARPPNEKKKSIINGEEATLIASHSHTKKLSIQDFLVEKIIGKGAFGKVLLVKKANNPTKLYAMKVMKKSDIYTNKLVENIVLEKNILQKNRHQFVVDLKYAFQTSSKIYLVMEYLEGGELFNLLRKHKRFSEDAARFYLAEVLLGINYLHKEMNIIYRDLKPENILLNAKGHIKITDFGLSKQTEGKAYTFAGTPEYLAPEILINKGHTKSVDFWSLGILLYEMMAGRPPFTSNDRNFHKIEKAILDNKPVFPDFFSPIAIDFLKGLLETSPEKRLGSRSIDDIRNHTFFKSLSWEDLIKLKVNPPFIPEIRKQNFQNPGMEIKESYDATALPNLPGITYNPENPMNSQKEGLVAGFNFDKKNKINEIMKRK